MKNINYKSILALLLTAVFAITNSLPVFADSGQAIEPETYISDEFIELYSDFTIDDDGQISSVEYDVEIPVSDESSSEKKFITIDGKIRYSYDSVNKRFDFDLNLDAPYEIIKPSISSVSMTISRSNTTSGTYTSVATKDFSKPGYLKWHNMNIAPKTGHYKVAIKVTMGSGNTSSSIPTTPPTLINRTGKVWAFNYTDSLSGKKVTEPNAGWAKETLYDRLDNQCALYQAEYRRLYNSSFTLSSAVAVHHIRPLNFGGSNAFSNLIHLPTTSHTPITSWFAGY